MKFILFGFALLQSSLLFSQSAAEKEILHLSQQIFTWEVSNSIDSLNAVFHDKFIVVSADGSSQLKSEYLPKLRSGAFIHDSIAVEESNAIVSGNTAVVNGKGKFTVTISGKKIKLRLSYLEVFTRPNVKSSWQVLAMKAGILQ